MSDKEQIKSYKVAAAEAFAQQLVNGLTVGLGSGSTAELAVEAIGRRVQDGLQITGVPSSEKTARLATKFGIPLTTLEDSPVVDVAFDGADEVEESTLFLIKGGGGNLLREKLVILASKRTVIIVDASKIVAQLGTGFSVPVEVIPFGWKTTEARLEALGARPVLRLDAEGKAMVTDGGHYLLDCAFGRIPQPEALQTQLDGVVGVVEHGLFLGVTDEVLVGGPDGVTTLLPTGR